jgi:hypothetical protein
VAPLMFGHTRWSPLLREFAGRAHREARVTLARPLAPAKWLFVVGCYNSGTTLLAELLGRHPEIAALPDEGQYLTDQLVRDYEVGLPRMWAEREALFRMTEDSIGPDVVRIKKEWAVRIAARRSVVVEKTPANIARTRWLQRHFRDAYFVVLIRNGYAVAEGIARKAEPRHREIGWPLDLCARQWRRCYEVVEEDAPHLERLLWMKYEDLTAEANRELRRIFEFVGVDPDFSIDAAQSWSVHEREQALANLNEESIARLDRSALDLINSVAADSLARYGYELR